MSDIPSPERPEDADAALAGEYVLRLLGPDETAACAAREVRDRDFAALVALWRADLEGLDVAFDEVAPPAGLERRIRERLFGERRPERSGFWRSVGLWQAAAAVAALVAVWFAVVPKPQPPGAPALVSSLAPVGSDVALLAVFDPAASVINVNRTSGTVPTGRSLQLWAIVGDTPPVSLGVLPDTPRARIPVSPDVAARLEPGVTLAISNEPLGGSTTGAPTLPPVSAGSLSEI